MADRVKKHVCICLAVLLAFLCFIQPGSRAEAGSLPLELSVMREAQRIYDDITSEHSAWTYYRYNLRRKEDYIKRLNKADLHGKVYETFLDLTCK